MLTPVQTSPLLSVSSKMPGLIRITQAQDKQPIALSRTIRHPDDTSMQNSSMYTGPIYPWVKCPTGIKLTDWESLPDDVASSLQNRAILDRASLLTKRIDFQGRQGNSYHLIIIQGAVFIETGDVVIPVIQDDLSAHERLAVTGDISTFYNMLSATVTPEEPSHIQGKRAA